MRIENGGREHVYTLQLPERVTTLIRVLSWIVRRVSNLDLKKLYLWYKELGACSSYRLGLDLKC